MSDKTSYTIEVLDAVNPYNGEGEDNWGPVYGQTFDTFSDAEEALVDYLSTYREIQIVKHQRSVAASYKDGAANG